MNCNEKTFKYLLNIAFTSFIKPILASGFKNMNFLKKFCLLIYIYLIVHLKRMINFFKLN